MSCMLFFVHSRWHHKGTSFSLPLCYIYHGIEVATNITHLVVLFSLFGEFEQTQIPMFPVVVALMQLGLNVAMTTTLIELDSIEDNI